MAATLHVFTYKAGLLARLAHDLRLHLGHFEVRLEAGTLQADFELASLQVDGVMRRGALDAEALSANDQRQILAHALTDVLAVEQYPVARFEGRLQGSLEAPQVTGTLQLKGQVQPVTVQASSRAGEALARVRLVPSRFGIAPFKALGGAIKLQDAIDVELRLPREGGAEGEDLASIQQTWGPAKLAD